MWCGITSIPGIKDFSLRVLKGIERYTKTRQSDQSVFTLRITLILKGTGAMQLKVIIIHESLKLFSFKGLPGTTTSDILKITGSPRGGFYFHYPAEKI